MYSRTYSDVPETRSLAERFLNPGQYLCERPGEGKESICCLVLIINLPHITAFYQTPRRIDTLLSRLLRVLSPRGDKLFPPYPAFYQTPLHLSTCTTKIIYNSLSTILFSYIIFLSYHEFQRFPL